MYSDGKTLPPHWQNMVMRSIRNTGNRSKHYDKGADSKGVQNVGVNVDGCRSSRTRESLNALLGDVKF